MQQSFGTCWQRWTARPNRQQHYRQKQQQQGRVETLKLCSFNWASGLSTERWATGAPA
jgi:hypothetical protein